MNKDQEQLEATIKALEEKVAWLQLDNVNLAHERDNALIKSREKTERAGKEIAKLRTELRRRMTLEEFNALVSAETV